MINCYINWVNVAINPIFKYRFFIPQIFPCAITSCTVTYDLLKLRKMKLPNFIKTWWKDYLKISVYLKFVLAKWSHYHVYRRCNFQTQQIEMVLVQVRRFKIQTKFGHIQKIINVNVIGRGLVDFSWLN